MSRVVVAPVSELPPGTRTTVRVGGRAIAVFNVNGHLYAIRNVCPHQGAPLAEGVIVGELTSSGPGDYEFDDCRPHIKCPWHGWEYDLSTGQSTYDPTNDRVRTYEASVESGREILAGCALEDGQGGCRLPGPYRVETIVVSVEDDYVVLDV